MLAEATLEAPARIGRMPGMASAASTASISGYMLAEMQYLQRTYPGARW